MAENVFTDEIAVDETAVTDSTADVQERKNKSKKITVVVTYVITLLCLLAGLLVPLFNFVSSVPVSERMLIRYLPSMLNDVFVLFAKKQVIPSNIPWFIDVYSGSFNFGSLVCVLYALLTVVALFMLIPVCLGKKHKKTSVNCALSIEIIAVILATAYVAFTVFYRAYALGGERILWNDYNFLVVLGGALITAIIQSVLYKGGLGASKTIAAVLSTLSVIALLDITLIIPALFSPLSNLSNTLKSGMVACFIDGLALPSGMGIDGTGIIFLMKNAYKTVFGNGAYIGTLYVLLMLVSVLTLLNMVCDAIGLATGSKYKKDGLPARNAFSNIFALVRYSATFVFAVLLIILAVMRQGIMPGIYLYLLTALTLFALINAIVRTAIAFARAKKGATNVEAIENTVIADPGFVQPEAEPVYAQPVYEEPVYEQPVYEEPVYEQPAYQQSLYEQPVYGQPAYEEPVYEQPAYEQPVYDRFRNERSLYRNPVYEQPTFDDYKSDEEPVKEEPLIDEPEVKTTAPVEQPAPAPVAEAKPAPAPAPETVYVYGGDTDEFMDTLTDKEKVEFVEVFLKKSKGTVNGVPDYSIKGDNSDFFPAVFVHINRYRDKLSDALMSKMYKQLGK